MNVIGVLAATLLLLVASNHDINVIAAFTPILSTSTCIAQFCGGSSSIRSSIVLHETHNTPPTPLTGHDRRSRFESYAPFANDGRVGFYGEIGRSAGNHNDQQRGSEKKNSSSSSTFSSSTTTTASSVLALPPPPPPKQYYGIGSWKKSSSVAGGETHNKAQGVVRHLRRPIVAGNWKLNPSTRGEAITLLKLLAANFIHHRDHTTSNGLSSSSSSSSSLPEVVIFPPLPYLSDAVQILAGSGIQVGAQTVGPNEKGAYTGEIAPSMLVSSGCSHILLGHSERRSMFGESDAYINTVLHKCLQLPSVKVILCIGESLVEYESGLLESVIDKQIRGCLMDVDAKALKSDRIILAYEPVWAIGTGLTATPSQAQYAHEVIRSSLAQYYDSEEVASAVRIQYGGSVTPENMEALMSEKDVDGALVGGASLNADSFTRIYDGAVVVSKAKRTKTSTAISLPPPHELVAMEVLPTKNALGESPIWSDRDQALYWVSATEGEVWRWNLIDPPYRRLVNTAVGCIGLRARISNALVIAGESAILATTMASSTTDDGGGGASPILSDFASGPRFLAHRPDHMSTTRPNDGRVDRFGNFVVGMYNQYHRAGATEGANNAGLYRLNARNLQWEEILNETYRFRVSNCICFSDDGSKMYFGDTPTRKVYVFDYSPVGPLRNRKLVWTMPASMSGAPDGAQVDAHGKLWIAITGGNKVVRLDPERGIVECIVHVGDANPTSLTFGGRDLDELFITTRATPNNGGGIWRVKMPYGIRGLSEPEFQA